MNRRHFVLAIPALILAGCGFELRRQDDIPFSRLYLDAPGAGNLAAKLRDALVSGGKTQLVDKPANSQATLKLGSENRGKSILVLSGAGRVKEYRLSLRVTYSVLDRAGKALAEPVTVELFRDLTYDDSQLLAKTAEEGLLYLDMEDDMVKTILRRLHSLKIQG